MSSTQICIPLLLLRVSQVSRVQQGCWGNPAPPAPRGPQEPPDPRANWYQLLLPLTVFDESDDVLTSGLSDPLQGEAGLFGFKGDAGFKGERVS